MNGQFAMFPHVVTVYNVATETNSATYRDETVVYITVIKNALVDDSKAVNVNKSGLVGADAVNLYIPFGAETVDGYTGAAKTYAGAREFWQSEDKSKIWTLNLEGEGDADSKTHERTFFVKGEAVPPPEISAEQIEDYINLKYDAVYNVTKVDMKDFGGLRHWEIGGN